MCVYVYVYVYVNVYVYVYVYVYVCTQYVHSMYTVLHSIFWHFIWHGILSGVRVHLVKEGREGGQNIWWPSPGGETHGISVKY